MKVSLTEKGIWGALYLAGVVTKQDAVIKLGVGIVNEADEMPLKHKLVLVSAIIRFAKNYEEMREYIPKLEQWIKDNKVAGAA